MRKILLATPVLALAAAACSQTANYKSQTEDFINDSGQVEDAVGGDVSDADCTEPESTDVGTSYSCVAQVEDVGEMTFVSEIDAEDSFTVSPQP